MLRILAALLTVTSVVGFSTSEALACKCKSITPEDAYGKYDLILWGEVVSADDEESVIKVKSSFKGTRRNRKVKFTKLGASCTMILEEGKRYMIFADRDTRDKETKRYEVSQCSGSTELEDKPVYAVAWTVADQPKWGLTKRQARRVERYRSRLSDEASDELRKALRKCDKAIWKGKDKASGHAIVRYDYKEKRRFEAKVLKYESSGEGHDEVKKCLTEKLSNVKFPKFPGGPVSVHAYRILDRIDGSMVRRRGSASVVPFKSDAEKGDENSLEL